jgi:peptidoglycan/LPS O-acetylase OafA/YrhL
LFVVGDDLETPLARPVFREACCWTMAVLRRGARGIKLRLLPVHPSGSHVPLSAPAQPERPKLLALQVLRAFAALAVVVHHVQNDAEGLAARAGLAFSRSHALPWLAGVDVFFVISGFIMVHASRGLFGRGDARHIFLGRRIARIVPLYWAATTLFLGAALLQPRAVNSAPPDLAAIVASYLFIPWARPDGLVQPIYSLGWTLNYEMFFYLVFALAIGWPRRQAVVLVAATLAVFVALGQAFAPLPTAPAYWTSPIVLEFVFGIGLAVVAQRSFALPILARIALAAAALVLLHLDFTAAGAPAVLAYGGPAAMLVAAATLGAPSNHPPRVEQALVMLGDASYALYLVHPFAMRALTALFGGLALTARLGTATYIALALLLAVAFALAVHRWFERPVTAAFRRKLGV